MPANTRRPRPRPLNGATSPATVESLPRPASASASWGDADLLRTIVESLPGGVCALDLDGAVLFANSGARRLLGRADGELRGAVLHDLAQPAGIAPLPGPTFGVTPDQPTARNDDCIFRRGDGSTFVVAYTARALVRDGELAGVLLSFQDITARKRAQVDERLRSLGELAAGIAHDFNNLLAVIIGRCDVVARIADRIDAEPAFAPHVNVMRQAARDGAETVRRLQLFSGLGREPLDGVMDVAEIVRDTVEFTRPRWKDAAQQSGIDVRIGQEVEPLPPLQGAPADLREVLVNLVFNAVDAMPEGGTIRIACGRWGDRLRITVTDTGVGMPDAVRQRIFEPFFTTKGANGAGLGLAMAYGIVSRMGGTIDVESAPGRGSTFTIVLPFVPAGTVGAETGEPDLPPLRMLVVDDEPDVLETARLLLEGDGHEVVTARNGAEALARLAASVQDQTPFDAVLTDLGMPGMTGMQLIGAIRAAGWTVPCLLVTGWGTTLVLDEVIAAGGQGLLAKPYDAAELRRTLAPVLGVPLE
jgi:PAS domain S-box-containing protein